MPPVETASSSSSIGAGQRAVDETFGSGGLRDTGGRAPAVSIHRSRPPLWGRAAALWVDGSGHAGPRSVTRVPVGVHAVVLRVALRLLGKQRGPNSPQQRTEQSDPHPHGGIAGLPLGCPWDVDEPSDALQRRGQPDGHRGERETAVLTPIRPAGRV